MDNLNPRCAEGRAFEARCWQPGKDKGAIKMVVIPDSKKETIDPIASNGIDGDAKVVSDGTLIMNFLDKHPSENRMKFTKLKVACKYASIERSCALC